jgi:hypothetical protein
LKKSYHKKLGWEWLKAKALSSSPSTTKNSNNNNNFYSKSYIANVGKFNLGRGVLPSFPGLVSMLWAEILRFSQWHG